jgi:hypothetical protein
MTLLVLALLAAPIAPNPSSLVNNALPAGNVVLEASLGAHGRAVYDGVRLTVSGSICTVLGLGFGALGVWGLVGAGAAPAQSSDRTVFTVLGWTSAGIGMVLGAVGIPLLIVGIVKLATPTEVGLTVGPQGQLALAF